MSSIPTLKDAAQVLRYAFDDDTNTIRTTASFTGTISVALDQASDSVAIGDGTALFTGTAVGPHHAEDVNVVQSVLPTGAATSAAQTTAQASLSSIDGKLNSLGQKAMAASVPVVIASDQSAVPVSAASLPLPSGAATAANQATANTSLASIDSKLTSPIAVKQATAVAGTVSQAAVSVGTSAVRITVSGSAPAATRSLMTVTPDSASTAKFYIGSASVTSSGATRGMPIIPGESIAFVQDAGDYYIVSDTAAQTVYILEQA